MVAAGGMVPWTVKDAAGFAAGVDHTLTHIGLMNEDPSSKDQANTDWAELQQINESAKPLLEALNQQQQAQQQQGLSPELQMRHLHKVMDLELKAQQLGLNAANIESQAKQRTERDKRADRNQFVQEQFQKAQLGLSVQGQNFDQKATVEKIRNDRRKTQITAEKKKETPTKKSKK